MRDRRGLCEGPWPCGSPGERSCHRQRSGRRASQDVGSTSEGAWGTLAASQRAGDGEPGLRPTELPMGVVLDTSRLITPRELGYTLRKKFPRSPLTSFTIVVYNFLAIGIAKWVRQLHR